MRILVFGKNGQVARALSDTAAAKDTVCALGRAEADLAVAGAGGAAIAKHRPDIVINAAAYTAVDKAETERDAAQRLNEAAPGELARAARECGAQFIHLSTDYVFDGASDRPLDETAPTAPLNHYGATKLAGEAAVMSAYDQAVILRTSWVFSEYGGNFVATMLRLAEQKDALSIVADQIGGPTEARDIARAALRIAGKKYRGAPEAGVYHFQGTPAISWAGFAEKIFEIAGANVTVTSIPTADYPTPAIRPLTTILDCARIERDFGLGQPDWRTALRRVMPIGKSKEDHS